MKENENWKRAAAASMATATTITSTAATTTATTWLRLLSGRSRESWSTYN